LTIDVARRRLCSWSECMGQCICEILPWSRSVDVTTQYRPPYSRQKSQPPNIYGVTKFRLLGLTTVKMLQIGIVQMVIKSFRPLVRLSTHAQSKIFCIVTHNFRLGFSCCSFVIFYHLCLFRCLLMNQQS